MAILDRTEKELFRKLADEFDDHMSNATCNDFDLSEFITDVEERRKFLRKLVHENYGPNPQGQSLVERDQELKDIDESKADYTTDFQIWYHLVKKILS